MIKSLMRRSEDFSTWLLILIGVAMAITFGVFMWLFVSAVHAWSTGIEHPIERGLSYVAIAIVAHAFFSGSSPETKKSEPKIGP